MSIKTFGHVYLHPTANCYSEEEPTPRTPSKPASAQVHESFNAGGEILESRRHYRNLESGHRQDPYAYSMVDLDQIDAALMGNDDFYMDAYFAEEEISQGAGEPGVEELKSEIASLRGALEELRNQNDGSFAEGDEAMEDVESSHAGEAESSEASESERKDFKREVERVKRDWKGMVEANEKLDPATRNALIKEYQDKADALLSEKDLDKAAEKLEELGEDLEEAIQVKFEQFKTKAKTERNQYLDKAISAMDLVLNIEESKANAPVWGREKAIHTAQLLQNYFRSLKSGQTPDDSELKTYFLTIHKDEVKNVVQYLTGAFYEKGGKSFDEMAKIMKASLKDSFLDLMASRALEEEGKVNCQDNIQWTLEGSRRLTYWTPGETSKRIGEARSRQDLQYLSGDSPLA